MQVQTAFAPQTALSTAALVHVLQCIHCLKADRLLLMLA